MTKLPLPCRKITSNSLNARLQSNNFKTAVQQFIAEDKVCSFYVLNQRCTSNWKKFLFEVLAMVKQLGIQTFSITLSCPDLRWNELIEIIAKLNSLNLTDNDIKYMCY